MKTIIVTGTSSGLGRAFYDLLIFRKVHLICIARRTLEDQKLKKNNLDIIEQDLSNLGKEFFDNINLILDKLNTTELVFINNAGMVEPIGNVGNLDDVLLENAIKVNILAPVLIVNHLMKRKIVDGFSLKIVNISSGAADHAIAGWSAYCSTKAATKMFMECLNKQEEASGISVVNIDPGVIDTPMQKNIRNAKVNEFPSLNYFLKLEENGELQSSKDVADEIIKKHILL